MSVASARLEACAIARAQRLLARIRHEDHFAFEHVDELVFVHGSANGAG
jgi:hypothetical protein